MSDRIQRIQRLASLFVLHESRSLTEADLRALIAAEEQSKRPRLRLLKRLTARLAQPFSLASILSMTDWSKLTAEDWQRTDVELAKLHGVTPAAVGAARARHNAPASPAGHGGARPGSGRSLTGRDDEMTTAVISLTKGEKRKLMEAHRAAGKTWNAWAVEKLLRGL